MGDPKTDKEKGDEEGDPPEGMQSIRRVSKIPVIESTINLASDIYEKVKDSSPMVSNVLNTAESTLKQAAEMAQPVTNKLEGPLKKVDSALCTGLDYVASNVPGINLPPKEILENTKNVVRSAAQPAIKCVCAVTEYGAQKLASMAGNQQDASTNCQAGEKCCLHGKNNHKDEGGSEEEFKECRDGHCYSSHLPSTPSSTCSDAEFFSPKP